MFCLVAITGHTDEYIWNTTKCSAMYTDTGGLQVDSLNPHTYFGNLLLNNLVFEESPFDMHCCKHQRTIWLNVGD